MKFHLVIDPEQEESVVATVHAPTALTEKIEDLVLACAGDHRLVAYRDTETVLLSFSQITCVVVLEGKTYAIADDGTRYRLKQRLYELESRLPAYFIRINKSAIANEGQIARFHTTYSGGVDVIFKCGYREYVSRRCFHAIRRRYRL